MTTDTVLAFMEAAEVAYANGQPAVAWEIIKPTLPTLRSFARFASMDDFAGMNDQILAESNKIAAIKKCREITGWGLKEAKAYVDNLGVR